MYEIKITGLVAKLTTDLPADKDFTIEVKPPVGAVLHVERRTPVKLETYRMQHMQPPLRCRTLLP